MSQYLNDLKARWMSYRPTKVGVFWTVIAAMAATMILGFSAGGWTTQGGAREMAEDAAQEARAQLVGTICVDEFMAAENAGERLSELKGITSRYQRRKIIQDGGWAAMPGESSVRDSRAAAMACADALYGLEAPEEDVVARG